MIAIPSHPALSAGWCILDVAIDNDKQHGTFHRTPVCLIGAVARQKLCPENHDGEKRIHVVR
jgi:hypothetical protein